MTADQAGNCAPRPGRGGVAAFVVWIAVIGVLGPAAQVATAQETGATGGVGWIGARDDRFRDRFRQSLLAVPSRDLAAGWTLAAELGRPAVPLLWDMMQAEGSNVGRRLSMLAAAMLAGGANEDERLFAWLDRQKPMLEERTLAAMVLALGPRRARVMPDFWSRIQGPVKTPQQILVIAARLAAARFPDRGGALPAVIDDDPGVAAATAYVGGTVSAASAARLWNRADGDRHADLFWRGSMLCLARQLADGGPMPDGMLARARELAALPGDAYGAVRAAAALVRVRARDVRLEGARPDWRFLQVLASDSVSARALQGWLGAAPRTFDEEPKRLAVAYVLSREVADVVGDRAAWSEDVRIARHVATALAWRLLEGPPGTTIDVPLPAVPEWNFVRWASGGTLDPGASYEDPHLAAAARLVAAGRMSRDVLRNVLEGALWRWGSHPGLATVEQERLFVRDLLLVGSNPGGSKYVPAVRPEQRYRPAGIGPDDTFFDVAVALFDFLTRTNDTLPPEHRLR